MSSQAVKVYQNNQKDAIEEWHNELTDIDRAEWADAANDFCRYLKQAEADS